MSTSCTGRVVVRVGGGGVVVEPDGVGDGDGEEGDGDGLGNGMTPWSVGAGGICPRAGGCGSGIACGPSSRIARLMMKPKATTSSTPARITDAGMRYSANRRCHVVSCIRAAGAVAARRPDPGRACGYGPRGPELWRPAMRSSSGNRPSPVVRGPTPPDAGGGRAR